MSVDLAPEALRLVRAAGDNRVVLQHSIGYLLDGLLVDADTSFQIGLLVAGGLLFLPAMPDDAGRVQVGVSDRGLLVLS